MQYKHIPLKDFIKCYNPTAPTDSELAEFRKTLEHMLKEGSKEILEDEDSQLGEIQRMLEKTFGYGVKKVKTIDRAIFQSQESDEINVIIECKSLTNTHEFAPPPPTEDDFSDYSLDSKALAQTILYFLREHITNRNNSLRHIIICNLKQYFIIDAREYGKLFGKDKKILKAFNACGDKTAVDASTDAFYKSVFALLPEIEHTLPFVYFNLEEVIKDESKQDLALIYQLLSPQVLLKQQKTIDANTLNKKFYDELLYILGLEEKSEGGKTTIVRSGVKNTLADAIKKEYESLSEEEIFALLITWNNRVLFLCLLESMLLGFKHIPTRFLNSVVVKNFKALSTLFFEVLAKKQNERDSELEPAIFKQIPYLNSSLFDKTPLERDGNEIWRLDSRELALYPTSILKTKDKSQTTLPLLEYYLAFLQAYDFTTTPKDIQDNVKTNHDTLINSAVLGLVFEKLNGYKEGSFYTPSFITSYMCEDAINRAIITRFNAEYGWQCENLKELENIFKSYIGDQDKLEKFRKTFLSIRICDPAVGSGHFLVSALNYLIYMAYRLRIFGIGAEIALQNDELLIYYGGDIFQYTKPKLSDSHAQDIQHSLFNLKKSIIENCLFGVDINPNSCEITKLRLWIELLKHSYYIHTEDKQITDELQTLPNIDINIKCGNSLLSYFDLEQDFRHIPNIKECISDYKTAVACYKEGIFESKSQIDEKIKNLLEAFKNLCLPKKFEKELEALRKLCQRYTQNYGDYLAGEDKELKKYVSKNFGFDFAIDEAKAQEDFQALKQAYKKIFSLEEHNPFEWRFAFPEVLDDEGDFMGFDCVIGNPPYISAPSQKSIPTLSVQRQKLIDSKIYKSLYQKWDLYIPFIELGISRLCRPKGICAMIIPYPFTNQNYGKKLREMLTSEFNLYELTDLMGHKVFESAVVESCIIFASNQPPKNQVVISTMGKERKINPTFTKSYAELIQSKKTQVWNTTQEKRDSSRHESLNVLGDFCYISVGMVLNSDEKTAKGEFVTNDLISKTKSKIHCREYIEAKDFEKYRIKRVRYLEYGTERCPDRVRRPTFAELYEHPKLLCNRLGNLQCTYNDNRILHNDSIIAVVLWKDLQEVKNKSISHSIKRYSRLTREQMEQLSQSMHLFLILGILNSKYADILLANLRGNDYHIVPEHIRNIPIPKIDSTNQGIADKIIALVEEILEKKKHDSATDTTKLESQINKLVYTLYNLTDEEIELIEKG